MLFAVWLPARPAALRRFGFGFGVGVARRPV